MPITTVEDILSEDFECPELNFELSPIIELAQLHYEFMPMGKERRTFKERVNRMIDQYNENRGRIFYQYL